MEVSSNLARLPEMDPSHTHRKCLENQAELSSGISKLEKQGQSEGNDSIGLAKKFVQGFP